MYGRSSATGLAATDSLTGPARASGSRAVGVAATGTPSRPGVWAPGTGLRSVFSKPAHPSWPQATGMTNSARDNAAAAPVTQAVTPSSPDWPPTIWPTVRYPDPQAAIDFLVSVFGFEPTALIPGEEPGSYLEIELRWPHGSGGIIIADAPGPVPNWLYGVSAPTPAANSPRAASPPARADRPARDLRSGRPSTNRTRGTQRVSVITCATL